MSERIAQLIQQFEDTHQQVVDYCSSINEHEWQVLVPGEQRTVGVLFQHIAASYTVETDVVRAMVNGEPIPAIFDDQALLDQMNAADAITFRDGTRADTLQQLDHHAGTTVEYLRGLTDADLEQSAPIGIVGGDRWTVEEVIGRILVGHPWLHIPGIREALAAEGSAPAAAGDQ